MGSGASTGLKYVDGAQGAQKAAFRGFDVMNLDGAVSYFFLQFYEMCGVGRNRKEQKAEGIGG